MKTMTFALLMFAASIQTTPAMAMAIDPLMCSRYLGIPKLHADKFEVYTRLNVLTPLPQIEFSSKDGQEALHLRNEVPWNPDLRDYRLLKVDVRYGYDPETPNGMIIQEVSYPGELSPAYVYRVIFAHLLDRHRYVTEIFHLTFAAPEIGTLKDQIARGVDTEAAIKTLPSYEALRAFGFEFDHYVDSTEDSRDEEAYRGDHQISFVMKKPEPIKARRR